MEEHPRLVVRNFLSLDLCKELEFIHKSCCTVGYRPNVFSTTLSHLIATNCAHFIIPLLPIRDRIKEKVEEHFGCEFDLFVEFTGLISWTRGASIGWHSDDNRPYLRQRDYAAVCYLNSYGEDFGGGCFHFQDGEPSTIEPMAGDVVIYTADDKNIHSVDEITEGERVTITLWFSCDRSHDEDVKLLSFLSQNSIDSQDSKLISRCPLPASVNMYWFPPEASDFQSGFDIRIGRLHVLGLDIYSSQSESCSNAPNSSGNFLELLTQPLQLACKDELFGKEFANILHILQVVQFYCWKGCKLRPGQAEGVSANATQLSRTQREKISHIRRVFLKDPLLAESVFKPVTNSKNYFDWVGFSTAVHEWEAYSCKLRDEMLISLPCWMTHQSIFSYSIGDSDERT